MSNSLLVRDHSRLRFSASCSYPRSMRFLPACPFLNLLTLSGCRHPQLCVSPRLRLCPVVTIVVPQSHKHSHRATPSALFGSRLRTSNRENLWPDISMKSLHAIPMLHPLQNILA